LLQANSWFRENKGTSVTKNKKRKRKKKKKKKKEKKRRKKQQQKSAPSHFSSFNRSLSVVL